MLSEDVSRFVYLIVKEEDLTKRQKIIEERRKNIQDDWKKLNEEDLRLEERKKEIRNKLLSESKNEVEEDKLFQIDDLDKRSKIELELHKKYEFEKLKLEKQDLEKKLDKMQHTLDKLYADNEKKQSTSTTQSVKNTINLSLKRRLRSTSQKQQTVTENDNDSVLSSSSSGAADSQTSTSAILNSNDIKDAIRKAKSLQKPSSVLDELFDENDDDDSEMKEIIKHAKLKYKLKYIQAKKAVEDPSDIVKSLNNHNEYESIKMTDSSEDLNSQSENYHLNIRKIDNEINEYKKNFISALEKEKDALKIANELLDKHRESLIKRKMRLETAQTELKSEESVMRDLLQQQKRSDSEGDANNGVNEKTKQKQHLIEERKLILEKEALDLERLGLNIKSSKRLVKQKVEQINVLEGSLFGAEDGDDEEDDDVDVANTDNIDFANVVGIIDETQNNNENNEQNNANIFTQSNIDDIIFKLKKLQMSGKFKKTKKMNKIKPILKSISKLTTQLNKNLENIEQNTIKINKSESFIDKKWKQYFGTTGSNTNTQLKVNTATLPSSINSLNQRQLSPSNQFTNKSELNTFENSLPLHIQTLNTIASTNDVMSQLTNGVPQPPTVIRGAWETSSAYHKLTHDSNSRLLNEKWSKYIGNYEPIHEKYNSVSLINSLRANRTPVSSIANQQQKRTTGSASSVNGLNSSLPVSIQQRLNEHREWLRKFKADLMHSNQLNNTSSNTNMLFFN